jgi:conserved domain protein|nr:MAG TPA: hypothetical protein [Siphoviridae sp. ctTYz13]
MEFGKYNIKKVTTNGVNSTLSNGVIPSSYSNFNFPKFKIFGVEFDGKNDVKGDITEVKNITSIGGEVNIKKNDDDEGGNLNVDKIVKTDTLIANEITAQFGDLKTASIENLNANDVNALEGNFRNILASKSTIFNLLSNEITVDNLTVNKAAHFFKLIIDEVKSVGGQLILSPSNATIDKVINVNGNFKCLFKNSNEEKTITNQFEVGDLILCQTFNLNANKNKFYWMKCIEVGNEQIEYDSYNYVILSNSEKDIHSNSTPSKGDNIVTLGNDRIAERQNAIILSSTSSSYLDNGVKAPSICQYSNINSFSLANKRVTAISGELNEFKGDFYSRTGENLQSIISQKANEIALKVNEVGINLNDKVITAKSDNFKIINKEGATSFEVDSEGNLIGNGSAKFRGCISNGITKITKSNFSDYIINGTYGGIRIDKLMPRIEFGNNEAPINNEKSYFKQQNFALPQMFATLQDGNAIVGGMDLKLKKSEWNELCRNFSGNYFYFYNRINANYLNSSITFYGELLDIPQYGGYLTLNAGEFVTLKCEIGVGEDGYEKLNWKFIAKGKISI